MDADETDGGPQWEHQMRFQWGRPPLAFSQDGRLLAGIQMNDKMLLIWDVDSREIVARIPQFAQINALSFSADGTRLATGFSNGSIEIWQVGQEQS